MKSTLIYDIASCPMDAGLTMEKIMYIYNEHKVVLWDSGQTEGCVKPEVVNLPINQEVNIFDMATEKGRNFYNNLRRDVT